MKNEPKQNKKWLIQTETPGVNNQQSLLLQQRREHHLIRVYTTICRMILGPLLSKHRLQINRDSDCCSRVWSPYCLATLSVPILEFDGTLVIDAHMKQVSLISDAKIPRRKKTLTANIFNTLFLECLTRECLIRVLMTHSTFDKDIQTEMNLYVISYKHQHIFSWNQQQSIKTR